MAVNDGGEIAQQILLKFAADTSQAISDLNRLVEAEKEASKSHVMGLADVKAGIDLVVQGYQMAKQAITDFAKDQRLAVQAGTVDIKALTDATKGLLTQDELVEFAAKANVSAYKLTQKELDGVASSMVALRNKGFELHQVQQDLTNFLITGNAKALRQYGINVDEARGSVAAFDEGLRQLLATNEEAGATTDRVGDEFLQAGVKFEDAMDNFKDSLAELAIALTPVIQKLAAAIGLATQLVDGLKGKGNLPGKERGGFFASPFGEGGELAATLGSVFGMNPAGKLASTVLEKQREQTVQEAMVASTRANMLGWELANAAVKEGAKKRRGGRGRGGGPVEYEFGGGGVIYDPRYDVPLDLDRLDETTARSDAGVNLGDLRVQPSEAQIQRWSENASGKAYSATQNANELIGHNGIDLTNKGLGETIKTLGVATGAFGDFQSAATTAFTSIMLGTESLGAAFKKMAATVLVSQGQKLFGIALEEGVRAIVSLANYDYPGAAQHAKAAAGAGVAAAAVMGLARAMGAGGASGGPSASPGASLAGIGAGAAAGALGAPGQNVTIVLSNDFAASSQNQRNARVRRALADARVPLGPEEVVFNG